MSLERHMLPWTKGEEDYLLECFEAGCDIATLASLMQRTTSAVCGRLVLLDRLVCVRRRSGYARICKEIYVSFNQLKGEEDEPAHR